MIKAAIAAAIATAATMASAQSSPTSVARQDGPNNDPSQIICRVENDIGSRLSRTRVCRTRAEWAEHARQVRDRTERAQQQRQDDYN